MADPQIAVIVPTINEAGNLSELVPRLVVALRAAGHGCEIVIVDDGSTDGTPGVARALGREYPVRLIERRGERGLASAVMAGVRAASGEFVAVMDADLSHPPEAVPELIGPLVAGCADLVVGSRYVEGGSVEDDWPWHRRVASRLALQGAVRLAGVRDPLSGFFALRRADGLACGPRFGCRGFKILLELIATGLFSRVMEVPITFGARRWGTSKLSGRVLAAYAGQLLRLYGRRLLPGARPAARSGGRAGAAAAPAGNRCSGFSLVELLVVVGLIALLVALLIPAIHAAREAARRTICSSRLHNLSLAIQNFQSARRGYPRSHFQVPQDVGPTSQSWSWIVQILPYIEEQALYDALDIQRATLEEKADLIAQPLTILLCPSDGQTDSPSRLGSGHFEDMLTGVTNYKAVCGANWGADATQRQADIGSKWSNKGVNGSYDGLANGDGIMWRDDFRFRMSPAKVLDGLSKTFLLGEDVPRYNLWNSWAYSTHVFGTCAIPPNYNDGHPGWWPDSMGFRSAHRGGLQFAMADGSIMFVNSDIDAKVYHARATRSGSELGP